MCNWKHIRTAMNMFLFLCDTHTPFSFVFKHSGLAGLSPFNSRRMIQSETLPVGTTLRLVRISHVASILACCWIQRTERKKERARRHWRQVQEHEQSVLVAIVCDRELKMWTKATPTTAIITKQECQNAIGIHTKVGWTSTFVTSEQQGSVYCVVWWLF